MFFVIVAEALNGLLDKAKHRGLISGFAIDDVEYEVTHLQFADYTIIFCDASLTQVENHKLILYWFELISGLKINYVNVS